MNLGFVGNNFIWRKVQATRVTIWKRLDRAVGSNEGFSLLPSSKIVHLECGTLDYKPIVIHPLGIPLRHQQPWRFKQVWLKEEGCHETVASA